MKTKIVNTGCCHDCGGRCVLKAHVTDGKIIRFETDNGEDPQIRACLRGRAYRQRLYSKERLKYPLKRVGKRGDGKFERISWKEAIETVATNLLRIRKNYGNSSILLIPGGGNQGLLHGFLPVGALLNNFGGFTRTWGIPSFEGALFASMATYGTLETGNHRDDLLNSKMIFWFGWNPAITIQDPGTSLVLAKCREKGIRIVGVDPKYTDSIGTFADEWVPIRPGTDAALLISMAYVIVTNNLHNKEFIDKFSIGFEKYEDYLLGKEDNVPKTPEWAEKITKVPADTIIRLAKEYASSKPAALIAGWGPARNSRGEQYARAANVLTVITGNIGIKGGFASGFMRAYSSRKISYSKPAGVSGSGKSNSRRKAGKKRNQNHDLFNLVEQGFPPRSDALFKMRGGTNPNSSRIHYNEIFDAILKGKSGGYPTDIKLAYVVGCNPINQRSNSNRGVEAFQKLDYVIVHEQVMTATAKFADIILPVNTFLERDDIAVPWLGSPYYIYLNKAIKSMYECKTDLEICKMIAKKLKIRSKLLRTPEKLLLRYFASKRKDIKDFKQMKKKGVLKVKVDEPFIAFKKQIEDPEHFPFPTLSGKIEIYSEHIAEMKDATLPPIPKYLAHNESFNSQLAQKYPLQLITTHNRIRAHSTYNNMQWLDSVETHCVWINPLDAASRQIIDGELIHVFNDRGKIQIEARVTERIIPGTVDVSQGAWYTPGKDGVDIGGCANTLTPDTRSPGGACAMNDILVQISRIPSPHKEVIQ